MPYIGEIRMTAFNWYPNGWAFCDGQLLPIAENDSLFQLIGTTYGGDGEETFALPDLRGRAPVHHGTSQGITYTLGEMGGVAQVTLTQHQIPSHTHPMVATTRGGSQNTPAGNLIGQGPSVKPFTNGGAASDMSASAIASVGGSQPHSNMQPYLGISFIISLFGTFPSQT